MIRRLSFVLLPAFILLCSCDFAASDVSVLPIQDCTFVALNGTIGRYLSAYNRSILIQSSETYRTCALKVTADHHIVFELSKGDLSNELSILYVEVEQEDELLDCESKYILFSVQNETCIAEVHHPILLLRMQGAASLSVTGISAPELTPSPPMFPDGNGDDDIDEDDDGNDDVSGDDNGESLRAHPNASGTPYCAMKEGTDLFMCDVINSVCRLALEFPQDCNEYTLGNRQVVARCSKHDSGLIENRTGMIIYPMEMSELYLSDNALTTIEPDAFWGPLWNQETFIILRLNGNKLISLMNARVFHGLARILGLALNDNQLRSLSDGVFVEMKSLIVLTLHGNQLTSLSEGLFYGIELIKNIYVQMNPIVSLNDTIFSQLNVLLGLDISDINATTLPSNLFNSLTAFVELKLSGNPLSTLPDDLFWNLNNVQSIHMYDIQLTSLSSRAFKDTVTLKYLYLDDNILTTLPSNIFNNLTALVELKLSGNPLSTLPDDLFWNLNNVQIINMYDIQLTSLSSRAFEDTVTLKYLYLSHNSLPELPDHVFNGLVNMQRLEMNDNELTHLEEGIFDHLINLKYLSLHNNDLTFIGCLFRELVHLLELKIGDNKLENISAEMFVGLSRLKQLYIFLNRLPQLQTNVFDALVKLETLGLDFNRFSALPGTVFRQLKYLEELYLEYNQLTTLKYVLFQSQTNLRILNLAGNKLAELPDDIFKYLFNLRYLVLAWNRLTSLHEDIFTGLSNLGHLHLDLNQLIHLHFNNTVNLTHIYLSYNKLNTLPNIENLPALKYIDLRHNPLTHASSSLFSALQNGSYLFVSQHEICTCYVSAGIECTTTEHRSPYLTCDRLLSNKALLIVTWVIGLNALGGNIFVLCWRKKNPQKNYVQNTLLSNLAISDSIMGVYMIIITSADVYFGEYFPMQSETWRSGNTCKIAGALAITSSEASALFVTIISVDRCINIRNPYSNYKFGKRFTLISTTLIWIFSVVIGTVPSVLSGRNFKFYDNSHVCIGLPLSLTTQFTTRIDNDTVTTGAHTFTKQTSVILGSHIETGLYFSSAIFLGLNLLCFLIIFGSYLMVLRSIRNISAEAGRSRTIKEQMKTTTKVMGIVATDFMCWFPIICMGILVQTRVITLPPSVYAWAVTFVLPINSAINPYLYTIADTISNRKRSK